ncbi:uncharacterized protein LOC107829457 isoform X3 [Nicotiana tabacum]|uniref:Uncharacterized protein LOC107829457 isoform X3 n=1 Tax=Nicotiana tabacum TaxID=4097 RepID=A0AC58S399_TOBAC
MAGIILFFMACVQEDIEILAMEWAIFTHELLFQPRDFWFNNYFGIDCKIGQNVVFNNLKRLRDANQFIISRTNGEILHFLID